MFSVDRGLVPWLKRPDRETGLSPLSGSDVKCSSVTPIPFIPSRVAVRLKA